MTDQSTPAPVALVDFQGEAFLACMWVVGFLLAGGLELRSWIERGNWLAIAGVWLSLGIGSAFVRRILIRRSVSVVRADSGGRRVEVRLEPAPEELSAMIAERARSFGLGKIRALYIPGTWQTVDGYATGSADDPVIVLSGGALGLAVGDAGKQQMFAVLVDHELAHVANGDIGRYYLARALLIVSAILTGAKAGLSLVLYGSGGLRSYQHLFPRALFVDTSRSAVGMLQQHSPSTSAIAFALVIYSFLMYAFMVVLYVVVVRRREFWADRVAIANSPDAAIARAALEGLVGRARVIPRSLWHPHPRRRVAHLGSDRPFGHEMYFGFVSALFLLTLLSIRFVLSSRNAFWADLGSKPSVAAKITAGIFLFFAAFCIDSVLTPYSENGRKPPLALAFKSYGALLATALLIGAATVGLDVWSWKALFPGGNALSRSPFMPFVDVELNSRLLLVASFPASVAIAASVRLLLTRMKDRGERILYTASFTASVSLLISLVVSPMLSDYQAAQLNSAKDRILRSAAAERSFEADSLAFTWLISRMDQTPFWWPPAFFMFWQTPFQAPTRDIVAAKLAEVRNPTGPNAEIRREIDQYIQHYKDLKGAGEAPPEIPPHPPSWDPRQTFDDGLRMLERYDATNRQQISRFFQKYARMPRRERQEFESSLTGCNIGLMQWYDRRTAAQRQTLEDTLDPLLDIKTYAGAFQTAVAQNLNLKLANWLDEFESFTPDQKIEIQDRLSAGNQKTQADFLGYFDRYSKAEKQFLKEYLRGKKSLADAPVTRPNTDLRGIDPARIYPK